MSWWRTVLLLSVGIGLIVQEANCKRRLEKTITEEYQDEAEVPNIFDQNKIKISNAVKSSSWEANRRCTFPNANKTIQLDRIREGLWIPLAYLRHSDNHLHPFVSPYEELRCLRVITKYDHITRRLILHYGCATHVDSRLWWDFQFEFLPNKRIFYPERYGCRKSRRLRRSVIASTDYTDYLLLHGCQSNATTLSRANALMVLVRTLNLQESIQWEIVKYSREVLLPATISKITYLNVTQGFSLNARCNCTPGKQFLFCKRKERTDLATLPSVDRIYYWVMVVVTTISLLMTAFVLLEQLHLFRTVGSETNVVMVQECMRNES